MAVRKRVSRSPGRPTQGVGDQREALLDAAKLAFARHGFAGASLRQIAAEAAVTPALAGYHFGDKAGLLTAVIEYRVAPLVGSVVDTLSDARDEPMAALQRFVATYTATAARNPWVPQLIVREVLNEEGVLRQSFEQRFAGTVAAHLTATIRRAQRHNDLRSDLDPRHVAMSLLSLCIFPFIATPLVSGALGVRVGPRRAARLAAHHWSMFIAGVETST
jgi:AcrR family transcriptional regulator